MSYLDYEAFRRHKCGIYHLFIVLQTVAWGKREAYPLGEQS